MHRYIPEELDETWAHLRHLGRRRAQLITAATASVQRVRDFLSVAWPVAPEACAGPFDSLTWLAAVQVVASRCGGQPGKLAAAGLAEFTAAVRTALPGWGGKRISGRVCRAVFAVLADTEGAVAWCRRGLFRRVADELGDLQRIRAQLRTVEADMVSVLGELGLSRLGDIPGLTAVGAAAILAETGDPCRYDGSSSLVKHAGLSPAENASGAFEGQAHISRRGRPGLRLAVWSAAWPLLIHNPVLAARYQAMTADADARAAQAQPGTGSRQAGAAARAQRAKARVACAAALRSRVPGVDDRGSGDEVVQGTVLALYEDAQEPQAEGQEAERERQRAHPSSPGIQPRTVGLHHLHAQQRHSPGAAVGRPLKAEVEELPGDVDDGDDDVVPVPGNRRASHDLHHKGDDRQREQIQDSACDEVDQIRREARCRARVLALARVGADAHG